MIGTQFSARHFTFLDSITIIEKIPLCHFNGCSCHILAKHNWSTRCFYKAKHVRPEVLRCYIFSVRRLTKSLAWEPSAKNIKLALKLSPVNCLNIFKDVKFIHPTILLSLPKNALAKLIYLHTTAASMTKKLAAINATPNTSEKMKFLDAAHLQIPRQARLSFGGTPYRRSREPYHRQRKPSGKAHQL